MRVCACVRACVRAFVRLCVRGCVCVCWGGGGVEKKRKEKGCPDILLVLANHIGEISKPIV